MNLWSQNFSQKTNEKLQGFLPWEVGQKFLQFFVCFLGEAVARQFCFEINWPLIATYLCRGRIPRMYRNLTLCCDLHKLNSVSWQRDETSDTFTVHKSDSHVGVKRQIRFLCLIRLFIQKWQFNVYNNSSIKFVVRTSSIAKTPWKSFHRWFWYYKL